MAAKRTTYGLYQVEREKDLGIPKTSVSGGYRASPGDRGADAGQAHQPSRLGPSHGVLTNLANVSERRGLSRPVSQRGGGRGRQLLVASTTTLCADTFRRLVVCEDRSRTCSSTSARRLSVLAFASDIIRPVTNTDASGAGQARSSPVRVEQRRASARFRGNTMLKAT
jgi:hypothetical protein